MSHVRGEDPTPVDPRIEAWVTGAMPSLTSLMAAANRIPGVVARGTEAIRAAANQLEPAAGDAREWLSDHPCPDSALGEEFAAVFDAFKALAEECTAASDIPGYDPEDLYERAGQVVADLMLAMYDTRPRKQ